MFYLLLSPSSPLSECIVRDRVGDGAIYLGVSIKCIYNVYTFSSAFCRTVPVDGFYGLSLQKLDVQSAMDTLCMTSSK